MSQRKSDNAQEEREQNTEGGDIEGPGPPDQPTGQERGSSPIDQWVQGRVVHHRYKSRFRPESGILLSQTEIWILSGPDQNQIRVWTGSGQNSFQFFTNFKIF